MRSRKGRISGPANQEPAQSPAMNTERTIEVSAVVTPNCAIDNRNQMSSHRTLQNPETKKNQKNHTILYCLSQLDFALNAGIGDSYQLAARFTALYTLRD